METEIDRLVRRYVTSKHLFEIFLGSLKLQLDGDPRLKPLIHSTRGRVKDPEHLRDKLRRKWLEAKEDGETFDVTPDNLFVKINDLAGCRLIHLYTRQIQPIDAALKALFIEQGYRVMEGPIARTWDDESRAFFGDIGIATKQKPKNFYTSVHYVIEANSRSKITCEIQVRTLPEEVWGEVDHTLNYPHPTGFVPCVEQLKVLARVTSSCTRLVDSIFLSHEAGVRAAMDPRTPGGAEVGRRPRQSPLPKTGASTRRASSRTRRRS
jgi:ppGpp synthetase/RelA/SpoT-type nucleotidyltranferase